LLRGRAAIGCVHALALLAVLARRAACGWLMILPFESTQPAVSLSTGLHSYPVGSTPLKGLLST
jgi:hypothetical protein